MRKTEICQCRLCGRLGLSRTADGSGDDVTARIEKEELVIFLALE